MTTTKVSTKLKDLIQLLNSRHVSFWNRNIAHPTTASILERSLSWGRISYSNSVFHFIVVGIEKHTSPHHPLLPMWCTRTMSLHPTEEDIERPGRIGQSAKKIEMQTKGEKRSRITITSWVPYYSIFRCCCCCFSHSFYYDWIFHISFSFLPRHPLRCHHTTMARSEMLCQCCRIEKKIHNTRRWIKPRVNGSSHLAQSLVYPCPPAAPPIFLFTYAT